MPVTEMREAHQKTDHEVLKADICMYFLLDCDMEKYDCQYISICVCFNLSGSVW